METFRVSAFVQIASPEMADVDGIKALFRQRLGDAFRGHKKSLVADDIDVDPTTISRWLSNDEPREPGIFSVKRAADRLGVSVSFLIGETPREIVAGEDRQRLTEFVTWLTTRYGLRVDDQTSTSVNNDISLSSNVARFQERTRPRWTEEFQMEPEQFIERDFDFPREYRPDEVEEDLAAAGVTGVLNDGENMTAQVIRDAPLRRNKLRIVRVVGDSMSDGTKWSMEDGELWSVDTTYKIPRHGDTVAVYIRDEGSVFGILENGDGSWRLEKRNTAYEAVRLPGETDAWQLIGRVYRCEKSSPLPPSNGRTLLPRKRRRRR